MSIESNERKIATIVFASALLAIAIIVVDELTTTPLNPNGMISFLRIPFGLYLGLFPVGYLALAFLFSFKEMESLERFGLAIAASISINVVSILLSNIFLAFPITLEMNLVIIGFWCIVFFLLFLFRSSIAPVAQDFWEDYNWQFSEREQRFAWLKLFDLVFFVTLLCGLIIAASVITKSGQSFNGIAVSIAPLAALLILLFPSGYFLLYAFFQHGQRSIAKNIFLLVLLSVPVQAFSAIVLFLLAALSITGFSFAKMLLLSVAIDFLLYAFIFLSERVLPIVYFWHDRRNRF